MQKKSEKVLQRFRYVSIAEGISFLLLLFIAMPLKYWADMPLMVKYTGWIHGVLFLAYLLQGLQTALVLKWSAGRVAVAVIASLLPFGPFILERKLKKEYNQ